ncbi:DUF4231 domain-containing protein [Intestinibacter bartlettii]|uniref:DUF4231 domain-containing protein n=1 Tax=Intestinibacter bartlettii TaxID=261299 RepID=UPI0028FF39A6|nr:DUF4231 domain-containing protein [Intestinibacter bartlettii]MDU2162595.1 DUF4231 domain-containing protein [Intestinibacter bartlettii]
MKNERNSLNKELKSIWIYTESIDNKLAKNRINHLLDWYIRKANFYKNIFYMLSFSLIVINALIPVLINTQIKNKDLIISGISCIATIITSSLTLFTMKDTWFRYRDNVESMKSECIKFANKIGVYKDGNESIIVEKIEEIVKNERGLWKETKFNDDEN